MSQLTGYLTKPRSRAFFAHGGYHDLGWTPSSMDIQMLTGPIDFLIQDEETGGALASVGHPQFKALDEYGTDRWVRTSVEAGKPLTMKWVIEREPEETVFCYYITHAGYDPAQPLTRSAFDIKGIAKGFARVEHNPEVDGEAVTHTVDLPADRKGPHVIIASAYFSKVGIHLYNVADIDIK
ncbi:lytic polysaccharide monooxygenase [Streptomyces sp. DSM 116496]|uniref:lytic polysaccharide monooxygenase n=1 Tax=Streptomyces stoeckheimensis TaxID=3344656 RepID=UPI0038B35119